MPSFSRQSELNVSVEAFLATITMEGVNAELGPIVRMTAGGEWAESPILEWPTGQALFKSWVLFLGILPIDRHSCLLEAVYPGVGFLESSSTTTNSVWRHERTVEAIDGGCRVTDRVSYESRSPLVGWVFKPVYEAVFAHRHRYLKKTFGVVL